MTKVLESIKNQKKIFLTMHVMMASCMATDAIYATVDMEKKNECTERK